MKTLLSAALAAEGYLAVRLVRSSSGLLEVPAQLGGSPTTFCLDSGAPRTCIDRARARRHELPARLTDDRTAGVGAGGQPVSYVAMPDFSIGPCRLPGVEAVVMDLSHVNKVRERRGDRPFDGALGSDILDARAAVLDYGDLTLYLREGGGPVGAPDLAAFFASEGRWAVKLARSRSGLLDLPVRIDGSPATLSLDTGASRTCLDRATVQRLALPTRASDRRAMGLGVADETVSFVMMEDCWVGPCRLRTVEAAVTDFGNVKAARDELGDGPFDGVIGSDILLTRAAVLDYGALTLYLREGEQNGSGVRLTANPAEPGAVADRPRE
jgi:predicted aspartyl protease